MAGLDERARGFLHRQRVAHLATATADGVPHVIPICFAVIEDTLYVAIDDKPKRGDPRRLRRIQNILDNPRVAVVADVYDEDWSRLGFVLVHAIARLLDSGPEHARALQALRSRYDQYRLMALEGHPIIAADIQRVTTWGSLD